MTSKERERGRIVPVANGVHDDGDNLVSNERLNCDSPVMWPDQNFCMSVAVLGMGIGST